MSGVRPRTVSELRECFAEDGYGPEQIPRGEQAKLLLRCLDLYERKGLLPRGRPRPLCGVCPNATACWAAAPQTRRAGGGEDGSVCLPWVGRDYRRGGVVVVAINPNISPDDPTSLLIEHGITWRWHIGGLEQGYRACGGSRFGFGAMRSAAGLLDVIDGAPVRDREPKELVEAVFRTARVQAIKCVPIREASQPLEEMWKRCPPLLLGDELDILKPGYVLVLGANTCRAVERLHGFHCLRGRTSAVRRGRLVRERWQAEVYAIAHPRQGKASELALLRSLAATRSHQRARSAKARR